jgi:hypothetical protein
MIVLFASYCTRTVILHSRILHFVQLCALFVQLQLNALQNSAFHISCHF